MPDLSKEQIYMLLGIIFVVLFGCVIGIFSKNTAQNESSLQSSPIQQLQSKTPEAVPKTGSIDGIYVHISGAVASDGVYRLNRGDRLVDLIRLSGLSAGADIDSINLAEVLSDGEKVIIPRKTFNLPPTVSSPARFAAISPSVKVNINSAGVTEFDSLPGIGPTTAKKILDHRNEKGRFTNIEELKEVPGISEKKFEKLRDLITVY